MTGSMNEQRKLTTIMAIDVAGYSHAAESDDSAAAANVALLRAKIDQVISLLGGRVFSTAGDGVMVEFPTVSAGVDAAVQLLDAIRASDMPQVRIGLHADEVVVAENGDLLGHGVNVAARLQGMAEPGTALLSQAVHVRKSGVALRPLGRVQLDKMDEHVDVFALGAGPNQHFPRVWWRRWRVAASAALVVLFAALVAVIGLRGANEASTAHPRLAVLRFEILGDTESHFAETLADELIAYASRMEGLDVIARASSFSLEGARATPQGAADELSATLVLTGSVRRVGENVRVTAQLAEAPNGRQLWADEFERPLSEVYLLQHEIAARVSVAAGLRANAPAARRVDPQAYEFYVRGREATLRNDAHAAVALYEQAIAVDPQLAAAWAYLAWSHQLVAVERWASAPPGTPIDSSWFAPALSAADQAIALDPGAPLPYEVRSRAFRYMGFWRDSLEASEGAIERGGGSASVYATLGYLRRATAIARRGVERDPLSSLWWRSLGMYCKSARDLQCAVEAFERSHRLAPNDPPFTLALTLHRVGRSAEALALTRQQERAWLEFFGPDMAPIDMQLLRAMLGEGDAPSSAQLLATLQQGGDVNNLMVVFAELNRGADAVQLLPRWTAAARPSLAILYDYPFAPMRARPQFWALMEREGILDVWREVGPPDFCEVEPVCEAHLGAGQPR
jgi:adenylate cyclase